MTHVLALTGPAGCGKDTVASYLVERYGYVRLAFADRVRDEVQKAYGLKDQSLLRDRATKEKPTGRLALKNCTDPEFVKVASAIIREMNPLVWQYNAEDRPLSPRQVLQWWGTEYRRAQDENYWVAATEHFLCGLLKRFAYPEHCPQRFVITDCRFPNEQGWVHEFAHGQVWHIRRPGAAKVNAHESENGLPVLDGERELWNGDTIDRLFLGVDTMMHSSAPIVRVEPMVPYDNDPPLCAMEAA